jgi:transcriptional regulator with XRE-family HTH domain
LQIEEGGATKLNNIRTLRERRGLTQEQIASSLSISRTAVYKWESGDSLPSAKKLPQLAKLLHCTIDELLKRG